MIEKNEPSKKQSKSSSRRSYHSPRLEVYGDIHVLTLTKKTGPVMDNPGGDPDKSA